jgi:hypothetical protein
MTMRQQAKRNAACHDRWRDAWEGEARKRKAYKKAFAAHKANHPFDRRCPYCSYWLAQVPNRQKQYCWNCKRYIER